MTKATATGTLDLLAIAEEMAGRDGIDLKEAVWRLLQEQIKAGVNGDIASGRAALERLCGGRPDKQKAPEQFDLAETLRAARQRRLECLEEARDRWQEKGGGDWEAYRQGFEHGLVVGKREQS